ncbi:discoidin domain-containing protein [Kribbella deserti]|uniref:Discoidin domain-containing protein n=1 Tax=Kribbella deserti TaxID=1926257 RepID=A0ABV6QFW8_9ACTN
MHLFRRTTLSAAVVAVLFSSVWVPPARAADVLLSQGKPVTTSSIEDSAFVGAKAVDGSGTTRWASVEGVDPQWLRVDLGVVATVRRIKLDWEAAYASKYRLEISDDDVTYSTVVAVDNGDGNTDDLTGFTARGRYLRFVGLTRGTPWGYSLWELQAFGTTDSTGDTQAPTVPTGLAAGTVTATSAALTWSPSTDNVGVTGYEVLRNGSPVATVAGTSYQDSGLAPDTSYSYTVRARDAAGNSSAASTAVAVRTKVNQTTWPGDATVTIADGSNVFGQNLSGLSFENPDVLWAAKNGPSTLYRLVRDGSNWRPDSIGGRTLNYRNGSGDPDAEAVVHTPDGLLVATERDGDNSGTSLAKVLRFDPKSTARTLNATAEWDLTRDLPAVSANSGPEAISWIPDSVLTARGFRDERTNTAYTPSSYPNHGTGLYFVGLEANGMVYAYALNQSGGTFTRVAAFPGGHSSIMDLEFEPETGLLWSTCDDTCQGRSTTLSILGGKFTVTGTYDRPAQLPNYNNEGFAIAPQSTCANGRKQVVWADDGNNGGHALRAGTLPCTAVQPAGR